MVAEPNARANGIMAQKKQGIIGKSFGALVPLFKRESVSEFAKEILREDETLRRRVQENPEYMLLLEKKNRGNISRI